MDNWMEYVIMQVVEGCRGKDRKKMRGVVERAAGCTVWEKTSEQRKVMKMVGVGMGWDILETFVDGVAQACQEKRDNARKRKRIPS